METKLGRLSDIPVTARPANLIKAERFAGNREARLGSAVGVSQFGVNHITLAPGAISALRHWHEQEDEFVYVLAGELVLIDDTGEHPLAEGDFAGFPAGAPNAHHLENRSAQPAMFLAVGTRHRGRETIHYPDDTLGVATVDRDVNGQRLIP